MKINLAKKILLAGSALLLTASTAIAAATSNDTFKISSKIFLDGKLVSSPKMVATANKHATLTTTSQDGKDKFKIDVIAKNISLPDKREFVQMNFDIQIQEGDKTIHTRPVFLLIPGKEGMLQLSSDSRREIAMKVVAVKG